MGKASRKMGIAAISFTSPTTFDRAAEQRAAELSTRTRYLLELVRERGRGSYGLSGHEQKALYRFLDLELEALEARLVDKHHELRKEYVAELRAAGVLRETVEQRGSFRLELVRCGKERCRCAGARGKLHGPYWYAYVYSARTGGHVHRYVGKPGSAAARKAGL